MPERRCQFEDLLRVSVAVAACDASGGLLMVVSLHPSHILAYLPATLIYLLEHHHHYYYANNNLA